MPMPQRRKGARVTGPYPHGDGFRCRQFAADSSGEWSPTFGTLAEAETYKKLLEEQLVAGDLTTETALDAYELHLRAKGNQRDSIRRTLYAVKCFFPDPLPLWSLRPAICQARYEKLTETYAVDSHRNMLAELKTFFRYCIQQKWLSKNPADSVHGVGRRNKRKPQLRIKEARLWYAKAMELANQGDGGAIACLIDMLMGLRAGETCRIRVRDLDECDEPCDTLWVPDSKTEAGRRALEIPPELRELLRDQAKGKNPDQYVFPARRLRDAPEKPHWRDWPTECAKRISELAHVPPITSHGLRGLLATMSLRLAAPDVSSYLGHVEERTTDTAYAQAGSRGVGIRRNGLMVLDGGKIPNAKPR